MFSLFFLRHKKNTKLLSVQFRIGRPKKPLTSTELARVNLLKVSVSENFLSQFLAQEKREMKID